MSALSTALPLCQNSFSRVTNKYLITKYNELFLVLRLLASLDAAIHSILPKCSLLVLVRMTGCAWVTAAHIYEPEQSSPKGPGSTVLPCAQEGYTWTDCWQQVPMTTIFPLASCAHFSLLVILLRHFCGLLLYLVLQGSILSSCLFPQTSPGPAHSSPSRFLQASYISNPSASCQQPLGLPWVSCKLVQPRHGGEGTCLPQQLHGRAVLYLLVPSLI